MVHFPDDCLDHYEDGFFLASALLKLDIAALNQPNVSHQLVLQDAIAAVLAAPSG
ncbi:hypothetical protein APA_1111 [Pseudanabaena sp. lw0831]|nr:hypothetical protein APA_1111 [Pseudanabaena sp. lw0831]